MASKRSFKLRCINLNIEGLKSGWFEGRGDRLIKALKAFKPDVVCLQEAAIKHGDGLYHQPREIAKAIGLKAVSFTPYGNPIEVMSPVQGGIAVLSRWPIISVRNRRLPAGHDVPPDARVALLVSVESPMGELDIVTTHLSWRSDEKEARLVQAGLILDSFTPSQWTGADARAILLGDFNATEDEPAVQLANQRLKDAYRACHPKEPGYTWSRENPLTKDVAGLPSRRIDYIFCPHNVNVLRADVVFNEPDEEPLSDHYGLLADLEWEKAA